MARQELLELISMNCEILLILMARQELLELISMNVRFYSY